MFNTLKDTQKVKFLFPADYFNPRKPDESFLEQMICLQNAGFETAVVSLEALGSGSSKIGPVPAPGSKVIYRGWMLRSADYELLVDTIQSNGAEVLTSQTEYLLTHYLPNWYPLLIDLTPATRFFSVNDDLEHELRGLGWSSFFIKDYVKSLKTSIGSRIDDPLAIGAVVSEMQKFRGNVEGGICVRQVEDFIVETEKRYFVLSGKAFAASSDEKVPQIVEECAKRISSKFFSVDVVKRKDGCMRVVEIGDGQVSDLIGWTPKRFAQLWVECSSSHLRR